MANRHLARSIVLQSLFEWDFRGRRPDELGELVSRNIKEFGPGIREDNFVKDLVRGIIAKVETLDSIIEKAARDWPIDKTPLVDRNVLRLGLYELLFAPKNEVPARVALDEAIELAKSFGGDKSGKFINGVLGTIYKEMGEPGKDEPVKRHKGKAELSEEERAKLPQEILAGGLVYYKDKSGKIFLAFVHDIFGHWTLSKGHLEKGESLKESVAREIKEEISLEVKVGAQLDENEYLASDPETGLKRKKVTYFLAQAKKKGELKLVKKGGLDDARWFSPSEIKDLKIYADIRPIIEKGIKKLTGEK